MVKNLYEKRYNNFPGSPLPDADFLVVPDKKYCL